MMEAKRKINTLAVGVMLKSVLLLIFTCWIDYCFPASDMGQVAVAISNLWGVTLVSLLFHYTYRGGLLKCVIGMSLTELVVSVLVLPSVILINTLEGREYVTSFSGTLRWMDLGIVALSWLLAILVRPLIAPFLRKYRKFQPRYKKILWPLIIIYFLSAQLMPILGVQNNKAFVFTMFFLYLSCSVGVMIYVYILYQRYQKKVSSENELLLLQMKLMEGHYIAAQQQIRRMESGGRLLEQQMEELQGMAAGAILDKEQQTAGGLHQRIASYLQELRQQYGQLQAGMYCNDWMVDAVLYCQIKTAKRQGISVDCSLQGYDRGNILEEDLVQILYQLLEWGIRQYRGRAAFFENRSDKGCESAGMQESQSSHLHLHVAAVKNQLVIEFAMGQKRKFGTLPGGIKKYVNQYHGTIHWKKKRDGWNVLITLER